MKSEDLTALIVDDEPAARRDLEQVLAAIDSVKVVGQASDAAAAQHLARRLQPAIIFMDIHLPGSDGFQALKDIDTARCSVIFTTAYSQFALRAFEVGATDYLLKPVDEDRCRRAIHRARELLGRAQSRPASHSLVLDEHGTHAMVPAANIQVVTAEGNYLRIQHRHGRGLVRQTLEGLLDQLASENFLRVSRKQAVRSSFVQAYGGNTQSRVRLVLKDGQEVRVSRRRAAEVLAQLRANGNARATDA